MNSQINALQRIYYIIQYNPFGMNFQVHNKKKHWFWLHAPIHIRIPQARTLEKHIYLHYLCAADVLVLRIIHFFYRNRTRI